MNRRSVLAAVAGMIVVGRSVRAAGPRTLALSPTPNLPKLGQFVAASQGDSPKAADFKPLAQLSHKSSKISSAAAVDVWFVPKIGLPVLVRSNWKWSESETLDPELYLGTARIDRENLPRLGKIVLTAEADPGPDEKGHRPIQFVEDSMDELVALAGEYAVWVVPFNGLRAERIVDRLRIQSGKRSIVE